jgi:transcriptional regulator
MVMNADLMKGSTVPLVLKLLSEREMYGYEMIKVINDRTNGALEWKEGTLYPCLHQLEADGLIRSDWRETPNERRRKYYSLTRKGRTQLATRTNEWHQFSTAINAVLMGA